MRIAITGSTGLIGSALTSTLSQQGHQITRIVRDSDYHDAQHATALWHPDQKKIDLQALENHEGIIHLAGENVAQKKWTPEQKQKIKKSRVEGTAFLCESILKFKHPPKFLLCASAIGFYGNQDPQVDLNELSSPGQGFLPEVVEAWEKAPQSVSNLGIRVVNMRFGIVLSPKGGAISRMLPIFKLGLGGRIGNGHQMMSWIVLDEISKIVLHLISHEELKGPMNIVSPNPVSNLEFTKTLGHHLHRPTLFPFPSFLAHLMLGDMADELLLGGAKVLPQKLLESGYSFQYPTLDLAFKHLL